MTRAEDAVQTLEPSTVAAIDEVFVDYQTESQPGASVAVVKNGEIVYSRGFGLANLEYQVPNTPSTIFHVASESKQFTSFAILLLAEKGKLTLDDDVRKYLDWLPDFGHEITIRHLMNHTSGIRDQWNLLKMTGVQMDDVITMEHIRQLLSRQKELNFEPGSRWMYCNSGYTLLAYVIEKVSGTTFKEFCDKNIFAPLRMTRTHFHDDHEHVVPGRAYSYKPSENGFKKSVLSYANVGATSLLTTVEDMTRWQANLDSGEVGGKSVRDKMKEMAALNDGTRLMYGFGLFRSKHKGIDLFYHGGIDAGFRSYSPRAPEYGVGVVVFANRRDLDPGLLGNRVIEILLKTHLNHAKEAPSKRKEQNGKQKRLAGARQNRLTLEVNQLRPYVGHFQLDNGTVVETRIRDGRLMETGAGRWWELIPIEANVFVNAGTAWRITFKDPVDGASGERTQLHSDGETQAGLRVKFDSIRSTIGPYAGDYYSPELNTTYSIRIRDKQLRMEHPRLGSFELLLRDNDKFKGYHSQFGSLEFERSKSGAITGFRVSNSRVRQLWFERNSD